MDKQTQIDLMWEWWQKPELRQAFATIDMWIEAHSC